MGNSTNATIVFGDFYNGVNAPVTTTTGRQWNRLPFHAIENPYTKITKNIKPYIQISPALRQYGFTVLCNAAYKIDFTVTWDHGSHSTVDPQQITWTGFKNDDDIGASSTYLKEFYSRCTGYDNDKLFRCNMTAIMDLAANDSICFGYDVKTAPITFNIRQITMQIYSLQQLGAK